MKIGKPKRIDNELIVKTILIVGLVVTDCMSNTAVKRGSHRREGSARWLNALGVPYFLSAEVMEKLFISRCMAREVAWSDITVFIESHSSEKGSV